VKAVEFNKDLSNRNTLGVPALARQYVELLEASAVKDIYNYAVANQLPVRILGGGSNLILHSEISALVIAIKNMGRRVLSETSDQVIVKAEAGENWHEFVSWTIEEGLNGLENLALIPGTVGAAPVQNIGAYGVEVGELIDSIEGFDSETMQYLTFSKVDCGFGYRDSLFKRYEGRYLITSVTFALDKHLKSKLDYGPLRELSAVANVNARMIFSKVCEIRAAKLPDPNVIPNAGSFFKNPIVSKKTLSELLQRFPNLVYFPSGTNFKLAAGWLIEQAGFKGEYGEGGVGCYVEQALVIVNPKRGSANNVLAWANSIQKSINTIYGVTLEIEPREWR